MTRKVITKERPLLVLREFSTEVNGVAGLIQVQSSLAPDEQKKNIRRRSANEREMEEQQEQQQEEEKHTILYYCTFFIALDFFSSWI